MTIPALLAQLFAPDPPRWTDYHEPLPIDDPTWDRIAIGLYALSSAVMIAAIWWAI